ncbi:Serpentine Receptor, class BC (Class B-like) [Caenorhabditis elegans]|uniref:Serpentine Receptor, class BC (Class B-like) n=1 Tax=Caenorhabditis elegans TaxID=6239 RepID=O16345_CAEEL|nr:Serpentine Receptor, class BC (Class B-like) [Caenorhabditis elegans]CCD68407.1 Serpentine Receptor, class BC (Class B-like) [Caenorhabditis elegans]|eukprot:NP_504138.3 Uncharacterized protein CELE_F38H12.5 [Caenorhabditis elegans]
MYFSGIFVTITAIGYAFITIFFCAKLLLDIYWFKTLKRSPDLTLFYFRFLMDILYSITIIFFLLSILITTTSFEGFSRLEEISIFVLFWAKYMIGSTRAFLAFLIASDRTWATYFPLYFFNYRSYIPNMFIVALVFMYPLIDGSMLFIYCENVIQISPGCKNAACVLSECYSLYWLAYEKVVYTSIIALSLLLSLKLYVWNKYKNLTISWELKRINRLALIDTCIILVFGLIPPIIVSYTRNAFDYIGPINTSLKFLGYALESYLVSRNLRKHKVCKVSSNSRQSGIFISSK